MIPKKMAHIWVGPLAPPSVWMESWTYFHPNWEYFVIDNEYLLSRKWRCYKQIFHYLRKGRLAGVADLIRYEYLYDFGGVVLAADSICIQAVDKVFLENKVYAVLENEKTNPGFCSPYIAAPAGHYVLDCALSEISNLRPRTMKAPWKTVGNRYLCEFHQRNGFVQNGMVKTLASRSFNSGSRRDPDFGIRNALNFGPDVYAIQMWGTTTNGYSQFNPNVTPEDFQDGIEKLALDFKNAMIDLGLEFH